MRFSRGMRTMLAVLVVLAALMTLGMVSSQALGDSDWREITSPNVGVRIGAVEFVDETVGYAATMTYGVKRTTDGGDSWVDITPAGYSNLRVGDIHFTDATSGWIVGDREVIILPFGEGVGAAADTEQRSVILHTDDGGDTWTPQTIAAQPVDLLNAVHFYDETHGFAVGANGLCVVTSNGGTTWSVVQDSDSDGMLYDVHMTSPTTAHIAGEAGILGKWVYSPVVILPGATAEPAAFLWLYHDQVSGVSSNLNSVTFTDTMHGYAGGRDDSILKTSNGGQTWESTGWAAPPVADESISDITFLDEDHGWAAGRTIPSGASISDWKGLLLVTSDAGATWSRSPADLSEASPFTTVDWVSESCGFVMGESGVSYKYGATNADRLSGTSRYDTAMEISADAFADGSSDYVVVATGANFADALSASGLAGAYECPLLLTGSTLTSTLTDEIDRVGASNVILVGGTAAIPQTVEDDLATAGYTVDRLWGTSRYDTAVQVGQRVADVMGAGFGQKVIVARGDNFADALAISPFAYSQKMPVLLVRPTSIPAETQGAFVSLIAREAILVGGEVAISQDVQDDIDVLIDDNSGIPSERWSGSSRYATAAVIAENGLSEGYGDASYIGVATGTNFPDALGGGVACGRRGGVLLLTSPTALSPEVETFITDNKQFDTSVRVFGGEGAVSANVLESVEALF